jgi:hypothetical protein
MLDANAAVEAVKRTLSVAIEVAMDHAFVLTFPPNIAVSFRAWAFISSSVIGSRSGGGPNCGMKSEGFSFDPLTCAKVEQINAD